MYIGDNGNDLTMIEWGGCGVAMANAILEVREIAILKQNQIQNTAWRMRFRSLC